MGKQKAEAPKRKTLKRKGRPPVRVDLQAIRENARLGQWKVRAIGRVLGISHQTLLGTAHKQAVLDAIEDGRALFEKDAYEQYAKAITVGAHPSIISALIFKMKQIGWSDKLQHSGPGEGPIHLDLEGAAERFIAQVEKFMAKQAAGA